MLRQVSPGDRSGATEIQEQFNSQRAAPLSRPKMEGQAANSSVATMGHSRKNRPWGQQRAAGNGRIPATPQTPSPSLASEACVLYALLQVYCMPACG